MKKYFLSVSKRAEPIEYSNHGGLSMMHGVIGNIHEIEANTPEEILEQLGDYFGVRVVVVPNDNQSGAV